MGETTAKATDKAPKKSWFKGLKAEFKKIIWPDKESLFKQSASVIGIAIVLGIVISLVDFVLQYGIKLIVG